MRIVTTMDEIMRNSTSYYSGMTKVLAGMASALPPSQRRGAMAEALRQLSGDPEVQRSPASLVFPIEAIPNDSDLDAVIKMLSGMGAIILAVGQAKPSSSVGEVMQIADTMMGRTSSAFSGDPTGIGMPVASAIAAAAASDPEVAADATRMGLSQIIAEVAKMYDCVGHKGPLSMVNIPSYSDSAPMKGGLKDWVSGLFNSDATISDKISNRAERKTEKLSNKLEKNSARQDALRAEIAELEAKLTTAQDEKTRKKLQRQLNRKQKQLARKEKKEDKLTDRLEQWSDLRDDLSDSNHDSTTGGVTDDDDMRDIHNRGVDQLSDPDSLANLTTIATELMNAGVSDRSAFLLAGYFYHQGIRNPLKYLASLSSSLKLNLNDTARYVLYVSSGMDQGEALALVTGSGGPSTSLDEYLDEARASAESYRAALRSQLAKLQGVNDAANQATRMYIKTEWADALLNSSDDVADILGEFAPDFSNTQSFIDTMFGVLGSVKRRYSIAGSPVHNAISDAVSKGVIAPDAGYALTGDPTMIPLVIAALPSGLQPHSTPSIELDLKDKNPVRELFSSNFD
jgi:hypothetical protein